MGQQQSLETSDVQALLQICSFNGPEIQKLFLRFQMLDKDRKGLVSLDQLVSLPELAENPLANRLRAVFDTESRGELNFRQFIKLLSVFSKNTPRNFNKFIKQESRRPSVSMTLIKMAGLVMKIYFALFMKWSDRA